MKKNSLKKCISQDEIQEDNSIGEYQSSESISSEERKKSNGSSDDNSPQNFSGGKHMNEILNQNFSSMDISSSEEQLPECISRLSQKYLEKEITSYLYLRKESSKCMPLEPFSWGDIVTDLGSHSSEFSNVYSGRIQYVKNMTKNSCLFLLIKVLFASKSRYKEIQIGDLGFHSSYHLQS